MEAPSSGVPCPLTCHDHDVNRPRALVPGVIRGPAIHLRELRDGSRVKPGMTPSVVLAPVVQGGRGERRAHTHAAGGDLGGLIGAGVRDPLDANRSDLLNEGLLVRGVVMGSGARCQGSWRGR